MIQRNRADQDLRDGGVFAEGIERTKVRDFGVCARSESPVLQGRKRLREEECGPQDQRMAFGLTLSEIWKSKMEIPVDNLDVLPQGGCIAKGTPMQKAFAYLRVSGKGQIDGTFRPRSEE